MKNYNRIFIGVVLLLSLVIGIVNIIFIVNRRDNNLGRPYLVEVERIATQIKESDATIKYFDTSNYQYVKRIILCDDQNTLVEKTKYDYCIRNINGVMYRFDYSENVNNVTNPLILINVTMFVSLFIIVIVFLFVRQKIIRPFNRLETVPYELARGNLSVSLEESKTKFFGKYIWGTNMLKESLENRRKKELEMHKDKKTLLLSLTHDIKTPLSVIKLNTQAIQRGLYKEEEKKQEALASILDKVNEIEDYVTKIIAASKDDFLDLSVKEEDFYLSKIIEKIREYYKEKLELNRTSFDIAEYKDCILYGDEARLVEVMQNLMENAIKYGDGKLISISFDREEECMLISVTNSGATLEKTEIVHVFDSFYRGSNVGNKPGSGLGLYICRKLMNNMNGDIFVKEADGFFVSTVVVRMNA